MLGNTDAIACYDSCEAPCENISAPFCKPFFSQSSITLVDMTTSHSYVVVSTRGIDIFVSCLLERLFKWATYGCPSLPTPSSLQIIDFLENDMVS